MEEPSLDPYAVKLERFDLFSTNQCYYLVGSDKQNTSYRVLKLDRTLIERPRESTTAHGGPRASSFASSNHSAGGGGAGSEIHLSSSSDSQTALADSSHTPKPTLRPLSEFLTEDPNTYTQDEIKSMLDMIHDGNLMSQAEAVDRNANSRTAQQRGGGLKPLVRAYGIVGFVRFLDCYYLTLITKRAKVGSIGGNGVYTIKNTETIPLKPAEQPMHSADDMADPSSVLLSMWNRGKRSVGLGLTNREIAELRYQGLYQVVDLTKNFLFSYSYDLTRSLQDNFLAVTAKPFPPPPPQDMYAWNYFLTREFEGCLHSLTSYCWVMPIIHGAFVQRKINDYGRSLNVILLARRSRHFAGTRYLKRGVSEEGKVANDVEHEQCVHDESKSMASGIYCSYLQVRGSLPVYWTQESSVTMPKPPIELNRVDPSYAATRLHFEDLMRRYSSPIVVLDLVKQSEKREREVRVGNEFRHAIDYVNGTIDPVHKIRYCALDYSHISKHRNLDVSASLSEVSTWAVNQTGFFCSSPRWRIAEGGVVEPFTEADGAGAKRLSQQLAVPVFPMEQNGVLRTNCIDCLDRTNVAQFSAGVEAIGQQLVVMGIRSKTKLDPSSNIVRVLIDMYVDIGDSIALQYGGSEAHKKVTASRSESNNITTGPIGKHKELLTSIRRYYSNAFTDRLKQDAMNLFLGFYIPYHHSIPLWEMETDYYLHNLHVKEGRGTPFSMKTYERLLGVDFRGTELPNDESTKSSRVAKQSPSRSRRVPLGSREEESPRVTQVRNRCRIQNEVLSSWWKAALQENITQRMWMHLGQASPDMPVPPRFERLYQPEKLGQFDRFFSRSWTTPVRRSHSSQHSDDPEGQVDANLKRVFSYGAPPIANLEIRGSTSVEETLDETSLEVVIRRHGFDPLGQGSLEAFLAHQMPSGLPPASDFTFIGQIHRPNSDIPGEYIRYVGSNDVQSRKSETIEEFKSCLHDYKLHSDDVGDILRLSESAHVNDIILSGPYKGLRKDRSAIEVATAIQEQFNGFESLETGGPDLIESELKRRGYASAGVKQAVAKAWRDHRNAQRQYTEIVEGSIDSCVRSEMTTHDSLRLYAMNSDASTPLSVADRIFLTGRKPGGTIVKTSKLSDESAKADSFVKKACRLGIPVIPREELAKSAFTPLYRFSRRRVLPQGFEQINEDLFARRDNKFMVFNGAGVDSWQGTQPLTKVSRVEDILFKTLS